VTWIALRDGAEVDDVRAWLYRIVHNSVVSILRRARHDCVELNEARDTAATESGSESRLAVRELLSSLAALPELQRRAIMLTAFRGSIHGEVPAALGISDGAVPGLVYRACASIRDAPGILASDQEPGSGPFAPDRWRVTDGGIDRRLHHPSRGGTRSPGGARREQGPR
jgi:DNA-directed RNA polymerase specialized sigma24 family protein